MVAQVSSIRAVPDVPILLSTDSRIALVGEALGEEEDATGHVFVGKAGRFLNHCLHLSGLERDNVFCTNVFMSRPRENNLREFFLGRNYWKKNKLPKSPLPGFLTNGFLNPKYEYEIDRLKKELIDFNPTVVIALGGPALWALTGKDKIGLYRGTTMMSTLIPGLKVVPTYHPSGVLRTYKNKPLMCRDMEKAKKEALFKDIKVKERTIHINPELEDLDWYWETHLKDTHLISVDIETHLKLEPHQVICISFSPNPTLSMVVPFITAETKSYWPNLHQELMAWLWCKKVVESDIPKLYQGGAYDVTVLNHYGISHKGPYEDTMIMHHAMEPELPKGLGVLGSIYCNDIAWKQLAPHKSEKKDD